jgi:hypothetical protein
MAKEVLKKNVIPKKVVCKPCVKKVAKKPTPVKKVVCKPCVKKVVKKPTPVKKVVMKPIMVKKVAKKPTPVKKVVMKPIMVKKVAMKPTPVKKVAMKPTVRRVAPVKKGSKQNGMIGGRQILRYDNVRLKDHLVNKLRGSPNSSSEGNNGLTNWNKAALGATFASGLTAVAANTYSFLKSSGGLDKIKNILSPSGNNVNTNFNNLVTNSTQTGTPQTQTQPMETQPMETQPQPIESQPIETQPMETQPQPIELQTQQMETQPIETQPMETQSIRDDYLPNLNERYSESAPVRAGIETEEEEEYKRQRYQQELNNDKINLEREKAKINQVLENESRTSTNPENLSAKVEYYQNYINDKNKLLEMKKEKLNKKTEEDAIINKRHAILRKQNRDRLQRGFDQDPNRRGYLPPTTKVVNHPNSWNNSSK